MRSEDRGQKTEALEFGRWNAEVGKTNDELRNFIDFYEYKGERLLNVEGGMRKVKCGIKG